MPGQVGQDRAPGFADDSSQLVNVKRPELVVQMGVVHRRALPRCGIRGQRRESRPVYLYRDDGVATRRERKSTSNRVKLTTIDLLLIYNSNTGPKMVHCSGVFSHNRSLEINGFQS